MLVHHISRTQKSVAKAKIAQNNSQVAEAGITVKPGQDSIHELIIWKVNLFVASVTCTRNQIAFKCLVNFDCNCLEYDEMETISTNKISIYSFFKFKKTEPAETS